MSGHEQLLAELRPAAFAIAYRMLGSVSEAEDVVQEALLRLHRALQRGDGIASPRAFLATITTRLAIDELRSARARRESYVGEWLPEPVMTDELADPAREAEAADSISIAMLLLLESLSPEQRAAFLLHDVFDYPYAEIAEIIGKTEPTARQLAARARRHVDDRRPRFSASAEQQTELAGRFIAAAQQGDLAGLEALLAHDVTLAGDGGGKVPALARSLYGRSRVAATLRNWFRAASRIPGWSLRPVALNGSPGVLMLDGRERVLGAVVLEISDGEVKRINSVVNPDKISHLGDVADLGEALSPRRARPPRPRGAASFPGRPR